MGAVNQVMLVGRIGHEPELRQSTDGGTPWLWMNIATNRPTRSGEATDWHDVRVFGDQAIVCSQMLRKGSQVHVDGQLVYELFRNREEGERPVRTARVLARRVTFLSDFGNRPLERPEASARVGIA